MFGRRGLAGGGALFWVSPGAAHVVVKSAATTTNSGPFRALSLTMARRAYAYAAPTMIFLMRMCGLPCEMLLVCVG